MQRVFVYGTLRPQLAKGEALSLIGKTVHECAASTRGDLYDLGPFPAMKRGDGIVFGDILQVERWQLDALDDYEEVRGNPPLYTRQLVYASPVAQDPANEHGVVAWAYFYNGDASWRIPGGCYAQYLQSKGTELQQAHQLLATFGVDLIGSGCATDEPASLYLSPAFWFVLGMVIQGKLSMDELPPDVANRLRQAADTMQSWGAE